MSSPTDKEEKKSRVEEFIANPRKAVWKLALPVMFGMAVQTIYSIVDMIFIGWLSGDAIAALSFNMPLVFFSIGITFGLGAGATSVIAQFLGAKNKRDADNTAEHALLIGLIMGVLVPIIGLLFKRQIFSILGASVEIQELAIQYFQIIALGFIFTILNVQFRSIMTGEGDTRTPIYFLAGGTLLNMILDPILIFSAGLGIAGAAWATIISQFAVFLAFAYFFFIRRGTYLELKLADFAYSGAIIGRILKIGIPASTAMVIMSLGGMFFNRIISTFGSDAVAALGVGGRLDSIFFLPTMALSSSMVTLAGMFYGAQRIDLVRKTLHYAISRGEVIAISLGAIFYFSAPRVFTIFTSEQAILDMAVDYIRVIVFGFPFVTIGMISGRVFQGLDEGIPGLLLTSMRVVIVSGGLASIFVYLLDFGLTSVWTAMVIASMLTSIIAYTWISRRLKQLEAAPAR